MYKLKNEFRMSPEQVEYITSIQVWSNGNNLTAKEKERIDHFYSHYLDGKMGRYDLVRLEKKEGKGSNVTRIKFRLLSWLCDYQGIEPDAEFFFSLLTCRESAQILASKVFYKE